MCEMVRLDVRGGGYFLSRRKDVETLAEDYLLCLGRPPELNDILAGQALRLAEMRPLSRA